MTPNMLMRHDVNTPSQVPNRILSETKKLDNHQGGAREPCGTIKLMMNSLQKPVPNSI